LYNLPGTNKAWFEDQILIAGDFAPTYPFSTVGDTGALVLSDGIEPSVPTITEFAHVDPTDNHGDHWDHLHFLHHTIPLYDNAPVGLLFAGNPNFSVANKILNVADAIGIKRI
jgi:hypothetical protein